jgi:2',3'-cyclic-nucleotide 2'-phosphodiesterase (5'-nucleotidase family)
MTRRILLSLLLSLLLAPVWAQENLDLTILHTNDLHGHMSPFAYTEPERSPVEQVSVGGAARRATLIRDLKRKARNPVMVIDAGDIATRGPLWNAYEGLADIEAMNAVGYDLACLGNNEFKLKDGIERRDAAGAQADLLQVLKRSRFYWIGANVTNDRGALLEGVQPYVIRQFGEVRVGFLGLTAPRSRDYPQSRGLTFTDPVPAAREWVPRMRQHCDIVIAVKHIGFDLDKQLAAEAPGIDAIVGGDSHTFLYKAVEVNGVPIVQTGEFGVNLGKFDLHFTKTPQGWKLAKYEYALLPIGPRLKEASDVRAVVERYASPLRSKAVAQLPENLVGKMPEERTHKTSEAVAAALQKATGADLGIHVQGDGFFEVFRRRELTRYDIFAVMPFKNNVVTASLTGADINALQAKIKNVLTTASGALDPTRTYRVALIDFTAMGTLGLPADKVTDTGLDSREAVIRAFAIGAGR